MVDKKIDGELKNALDSFLHEDYGYSIEIIHRYADNNHVEACSKLGVAYQLGLGVSVDIEKAVHYLDKAAAQGSGEAAHNLGTLFAALPNSDIEKAKYWFMKAKSLNYIRD